MKKMVISTICVIFIMLLPVCYANNIVLSNDINNQSNTNVQTNNELQGTEQIVEIKKNTEKKLDDYKQEYGSDAYGLAAYILNIVRICEENSIYCNVYTEMEVIAKSLNYNVLFYYKENARKAEGKRTNINIVPNMYKYIEELSQERFLKVTVCDDNRMIFNSIIRKLKLINDIDVLDVSHMSRKVIKDGTSQIPIEYYYTEITNKNVNKWTAIEFLLNKLHIQKEDVIGIGDNVNDKEMIENAGLGVAMGNSSPEMKAIADVVVSDNNSEGVAEVIRKFVLEDY